MISSFFAPKKRKATPSQKASSPSGRTEPSSSPESVTTSSLASGSLAESSANKRLKAAPSEENDAVQELLQYLKDDSSEDTRSWRKALDKHFSSKRFETLARFVSSQR